MCLNLYGIIHIHGDPVIILCLKFKANTRDHGMGHSQSGKRDAAKAQLQPKFTGSNPISQEYMISV